MLVRVLNPATPSAEGAILPIGLTMLPVNPLSTRTNAFGATFGRNIDTSVDRESQ